MAKAGVKLSSDEVVVKSPNDRRLYRYLELHNGLSVVLVHDAEIYPPEADRDEDLEEDGSDEDLEDDEEDDNEDGEEDDNDPLDDNGDDDADGKGKCNRPQFKKAAAAMCVKVGSFSDPPEAQGLAHFLEHMLFMGSAEFPDENEYDSYLSKHGGSSNAYTEVEHTCYYFEVKGEFLKGALKRFSPFFISPLVKVEAMEREILAVDSEFNQVLQSDSCRLEQLRCHTSLTGHPFNRFFWGNKKSLIDAVENGVNLQEQIVKLYHENYHGQVMKLVVIGGESLDVLENWVLQLFNDVKRGSHSVLRSETLIEGPIWNAGKLYKLDAVKDVHILEILWKLPCLWKEYLKKPEDYLAHIIGHEGRGSLHFFLKNKGWITSISAGVGDEGINRSSIAYIFGMSIYLTDSGSQKIHEIIGYVYQYLKLLRQSPPEQWIFEELQDIGNMDFRFAEEKSQDDYASELAVNLLSYPVEHVIYGDYAFKVWDGEMITSILSFLNPRNMRLDIVSKSFDQSEGIKYEPWFGSRYREEDVPPQMLDLWSDPPEVDALLHLPVKNQFIPTNFSVHANNLCDGFTCSSYPICILDEPLMKFWYKLDTTFKLPRANTYFRINLKGAYETAGSTVLTELFVLLLKDELNEVIYQASVAKLETSVSLSSDKLELKLYGFNDKLPVLLSKVLYTVKSFIPRDDRFMVIKEEMVRSLKNANMKPMNHATYSRLRLLCKSFWDVDDKLHFLNDLTLDDLLLFIPKLLSQLYIEALCHGNLLEEEAMSLSRIFRQNLPVQPLPVVLRHQEQILCLPFGANLVFDIPVKNKLERNSVVELYYQLEQETSFNSIRMKAFSDLLDETVQEPLFNRLRTKEQLGYVVDCGPRMTYRVFGFCFCVQSSEYDPMYLQDRIDSFIHGLEDLLDAVDDESYESYKNGLIAQLLEKDPSLASETNRLWSQIVDGRYIFDLSEKEAHELRSISKTDLKEWCKIYFQQSSDRCRRLCVRVWGCNSKLESVETKLQGSQTVQVVKDLSAFKLSSKFYPSMC